MASRSSMTGTKRLYDTSPHPINKHRSSIVSSRLSISSASTRRSALDPMENTNSHPTSDDLMHDMQVREKQANERTNKAEQERDELKAKINLLKVSHQTTVKTLVDQLEEYKALANRQYRDDDDTQDKRMIERLEQQLKESTQQVQEHQAQIHNHLYDHDQVVGALKQQVKDLEHKLANLNQETATDTQTMMDQMTQQAEELRQEIVNKDNALERTKKQLTIVTDEVQVLQAQVDRQQVELKGKSATVDRLTRQMDDLQQNAVDKENSFSVALDRVKKELAAKMDQVEALKIELDNQQQQQQMDLTGKSTLVDRLKRQVEELSQALEARDQAMDDLEHTTSTHIDRIKKQLVAKTNQVEALQAELDTQRMDFNGKSSAQVERLTKQVDDLRLELGERDDKDRSMTMALERTKKQLAAKADQVQTLQAELEAQQQAQMDLNGKSVHVDRLTRQVDDLLQQLTDRDEQLHTTTMAFERTKKQLAIKVDEIQTLQAEIEAQQQTQMDLNGKSAHIDRLTRQMDDLRQQLATRDEQEHTTTMALERTKKQLAIKVDEIQTLQAEIEAQQQTQMDLNSKSVHVDQLTRQVDNLLQQLTDRDEQLNTTTMALERTKKQLANKVDQIQTLQAEIEAQQQAQMDLDGKSVHVDRLTRQVDDLRQQLATRDEQEHTTTMALERTRKQLAIKVDEVKSLQAELDKQQVESTEQHRKQLARLEQDRDTLRDELRTMTNRQRQQDARLAEKQHQIEQLQTEQPDLLARQHKVQETRWRHEMDEKQAQIDVLMTQLDQARHNNKQQQSRLTQSLETQLEDMRRVLVEREEQLRRVEHDRAQVSTLKAATMVEKDQHISELEQAMSETGEQLRKMSHTVREVYGEKAAAEQRLGEIVDQLQQTQHDFDRLAADEHTLRQQIQKIKDMAQQKDNEWADYARSLETKVRDLEQELDVMQVTAASMEERSRQISDLEDMVQVVQARLSSAIDERDTLRGRFDPLIEEITAMKSSLG
ncbi:hypothetical protein BC941DRAFT_472360 [Chlamydoabsidia padenii]|nr:hypothetical protein BC941DRAFT_472360 [Chlamydoabsidia padenii]